MLLIFPIFLLSLLQVRLSLQNFYPGRVAHSCNEYPEIGGKRMSLRRAVLLCEADLECAGFTFIGTLELDNVRRFAFFRFIDLISVNNYRDIDWNSYHVERDTAVYAGKVPEDGVHREMTGSGWLPGKRLEQYIHDHNITAVSLSKDGTARFYWSVDLSSLRRDEDWTTYLNLNAPPDTVLGLNHNKRINFCCPQYQMTRVDASHIRPRGQIDRISCNMSKEEFTEKYVRTMTPVLMTGCDYNWLTEKFDLSIQSVTKFYHDNNTTPSHGYYLEPLPGFTHVRTPNSNFDEDVSIMNSLAAGHLRIFNRMRYNYDCVSRNSSCRIFERFRQPQPIPDDLYVKTNFDNDLDWVIISQENTGSHPHNDPDLTGAWNYLINGLKHWVIFPFGLDAKQINCDDKCSPDLNTAAETYRWFQHVLPQVRDVPVYGNRPLEFIQAPGEAIYLPHGVAHTVLNLRDNVAVTENYLFVDALPELMSKIAMDEISMFRPDWDMRAVKQLYYGLVSAKDRSAMRSMYDQAVRRIGEQSHFCTAAEDFGREKFKTIFGEDPETTRGIKRKETENEEEGAKKESQIEFVDYVSLEVSDASVVEAETQS